MRHKVNLTKYLLCFSIIACLLSRCGCDNEDELAFAPASERLLHAYHEGDTIYFSDESGNADTIVVSEIKSWTNNCMWHATAVNIEHLPNNLWIGGYEGNGGELVPLDQTLFQVEKEIYDEEGLWIEYRNFSGNLTDTTEMRTDTLFKYCNQHKYMVIEDRNADWKEFKNDPLHVTTVFWTERYGLSGYVLRNGAIFRIKR